MTDQTRTMLERARRVRSSVRAAFNDRSSAGWPSQRSTKLAVRAHESVEREAPVEAAWIGEDPGCRSSKSCWVQAPGDARLTDHAREGSLAEKGDRARRVAPHLRFELGPSLPELFRQDLIRSTGRPAYDCCDAAAVFEQAALVLGLKTDIGEPREVECSPEAIAWIREIMACELRARCGVEATEDHIEASGNDIWLVAGQANLLRWRYPASPRPRGVRTASRMYACAMIGSCLRFFGRMLTATGLSRRFSRCSSDSAAAPGASARS